MDAEAEEGLTVAEYASGEEKCGDPAPNRASVCARTKGHDGGHRNAWSTAEWPNDEHTPQPGGPGMQPCGNVGPFDGMTCERAVGHSGLHEHPRAGMKMVWSDVTDESVAKQLAALQRKVRAQANQINKLEELRRAAVNKQPEHRELADQLRSQVQLTMRENSLRRQVETERNNDRERRAELIGNLILDIRRALALTVPDKLTSGSATWSALRRHVGLLCSALPKSDSAESAERTRRFVARFYRLASLLSVDTAGETWDTLLQRVADLRAELEVERTRANVRKAELDKLNARFTGHDAVRMFMGPSAEYGTTPLAARVAELAKDLDGVSRVTHVLNERLTKLENTTETKLSDQLADAQAAAGWREQCNSRTVHGLIGHKCQRATGHTGQHNSDTASGEGREW